MKKWCLVVLSLVLFGVGGWGLIQFFNSDTAESNLTVPTPEVTPEKETVVNVPEVVKPITDPIEERLNQMTLEEKVAQLFMVTPDALTGETGVKHWSDSLDEALAKWPVGGLIYFSGNLESPDQLSAFIEDAKSSAVSHQNLPMFYAVDEEGGVVARIANHPAFDVKKYGAMSHLEGIMEAKDVGITIGRYLKDLGFNMDFAPIADVLTNPQNQVIGSRSFGNDPKVVSDMALAVSEGFKSVGMISCFKHFPGHGGTLGDTHDGYAYTDKTLNVLMENELIPFKTAAEEDIPFVMMSHISLPNVLENTEPASLSYEMTTELLKEKLGFKGAVVTDAMNMGAIANHYPSDEAAIKAIIAGADLILMPKDFKVAYEGVLSAVQKGDIAMSRINDAVKRLLIVKRDYGLIELG